MMNKRFLIIGNDKKMRACADRLKTAGYDCDCLAGDEVSEKLSGYDNIVLPLPTLANGRIAGTSLLLSEFSALLTDKQRVFYGNLSKNEFTPDSVSYYYHDGFLIKNSRLTAQGTLRLILDNIYVDLHSLSVCVIGYGRCGSAISRLLKFCGANVTSFSRRAATRVSAENDGMLALPCSLTANELHEYDVIINTVPSNIISETALASLTQDNLYIEVASKPYGFDIAKSDKFNFRYVLAESLPGRFTPVSAGINIAETILDSIKEV